MDSTIMTDPDIIARIFPSGDSDFLAEKTILDTKAYQARGSRDSTRSPEPPRLPDELPYLEVRLSAPPRTRAGLVFGTDPNCDIVIRGHDSISKHQFALTYKDTSAKKPSLTIRDLDSKYGTTVLFHGYELLGNKRNFDWILSGFEIPTKTKSFTIKLGRGLEFEVFVNKEASNSSLYLQNVRRFCHGVATEGNLVDQLNIQSRRSTFSNSMAGTPDAKPILLTGRQLGHGAFGLVNYQWDVSTGKEYAVKEPICDQLSAHDRAAWKREIDIMKTVSHEHIVQLCFWLDAPKPRLYLQYVPCGKLRDQSKKKKISSHENLLILHQSASALAYLHGQENPVAHRDLKPENILVQYRDQRRAPCLHVKLSDFGLSKIGELRTMNVGTPRYLAPEVIRAVHSTGTYTTKADIWSLGVIFLQYRHGLPDGAPDPRDGITGTNYCSELVQRSLRYTENIDFMLQRLLDWDPETRLSAKACEDWTAQLLSPSGPEYGTGALDQHGHRLIAPRPEPPHEWST
ncbi:kinase-like protein [Nemania sp. FL0916]|nr:kinase-like protein [Nemania sp. FL0916]